MSCMQLLKKFNLNLLCSFYTFSYMGLYGLIQPYCLLIDLPIGLLLLKGVVHLKIKFCPCTMKKH